MYTSTVRSEASVAIQASVDEAFRHRRTRQVNRRRTLARERVPYAVVAATPRCLRRRTCVPGPCCILSRASSVHFYYVLCMGKSGIADAVK